jgi:hypothetical protein
MSLLTSPVSASTPVSSGSGTKRVRIVCARCLIEKDKCTFPKGSSECVKCLNAQANGEIQRPRPMRKTCLPSSKGGCDKMKSAKAFRNGSDICRQCQNIPKAPLNLENLGYLNEQRKCSGCGTVRFATHFRGPTSICLKCWHKLDKDKTLEDLIVQYHNLKLEHEALKSSQSPVLMTPERAVCPPTPVHSPDPAFVRFIIETPSST